MIGVDALIISGFVFNIMKKSIPLKEIVGFLPYGLKVMHTDFEPEGAFAQESEIETISTECICFKSKWYASDYYFNDPDCEIKPIVRPLSYLTKEITHNGETFVPLVKYMTEWFGEPCEDFNEFEMCDIEKSFLSVLRKYEMRTQKELEFLYEHHFDIYDWIKDGKAIDINTL